MLCQITFLRHHPKIGGVTAAKVNIFFNYELKIKNEEGGFLASLEMVMRFIGGFSLRSK